jgi:hypothetical protein
MYIPRKELIINHRLTAERVYYRDFEKIAYDFEVENGRV